MYEHGGHIGHVTEPFEKTFILSSHESSTRNLASIGVAISEEKEFDNVESE